MNRILGHFHRASRRGENSIWILNHSFANDSTYLDVFYRKQRNKDELYFFCIALSCVVWDSATSIKHCGIIGIIRCTSVPNWAIAELQRLNNENSLHGTFSHTRPWACYSMQPKSIRLWFNIHILCTMCLYLNARITYADES